MVIRILLFPVVLMLVLYFVIVLIVPTHDAITAEKKIIVQKEKTRDAVKAKQNQVAEFISGVNTHPAEKEFLLDFLPQDKQEETLINDISQLAEKTEVSLFSIGFTNGESTTKSVQDVRLIEGRMIVSGTYENLQAFMDQLFHIDRFYAFRTSSIVKPEQDKVAEGQDSKYLNGTINFAYGNMPGVATINSTVFDQKIDYALIATLLNTAAQTDPLVPEVQNRTNPFLP